jgi:hypothetical protein
MSFMYEIDEYTLATIGGFKPLFLVMHQVIRKTLPPMEGDSSRVQVKKKSSMCLTSFFQEILNVAVSNNRSCAYAPYVMKMIEKGTKKTFVKNVEHTKL